MRRITSVAVALFATFAMLGLGACSSSDEDSSKSDSSESSSSDKKSGSGDIAKAPELSGDAAGIGDAMVATMVSDESMPISEEQARCYANRSIEIIGADRFKEAGITGETMTDEAFDFSALSISEGDANKVYDQLDECGIDLRSTMLEGLSAADDMSAESKKCFEEAVNEKNLREFIVTGMMQGAEAMSQDEDGLMGKLMACAFLDMDESDFSMDD